MTRRNDSKYFQETSIRNDYKRFQTTRRKIWRKDKEMIIRHDSKKFP